MAKSSDVKEAQSLIAQIDEVIESLDESVRDKHEEFFSGVSERASSIGETIDRADAVTDRQMTALRNMLEAVTKWQR